GSRPIRILPEPDRDGPDDEASTARPSRFISRYRTRPNLLTLVLPAAGPEPQRSLASASCPSSSTSGRMGGNRMPRCSRAYQEWCRRNRLLRVAEPAWNTPCRPDRILQALWLLRYRRPGCLDQAHALPRVHAEKPGKWQSWPSRFPSRASRSAATDPCNAAS